MYKIIFFLFLTTLLSAKNPNVYAALGDVIYDNVHKIEELGKLDSYKDYKLGISSYVALVTKTKELGFAIESGVELSKKGEYLAALRELSKKNDFYLRKAKSSFNTAIEKEDTALFMSLVNSEIIDTEQRKEDILNYYFQHQEDINASGVIQSFLDEDAELRNREAALHRIKSKKERDAEKIRRLRENDLETQKKLEEKLEAEVIKKKLEIRQQQRKELTK